MRIAVTFENENIFQHFGHTQKFKFFDVENNSIVKEEIIDTNGKMITDLTGLVFIIAIVLVLFSVFMLFNYFSSSVFKRHCA